jgi:hypothetical protein
MPAASVPLQHERGARAYISPGQVSRQVTVEMVERIARLLGFQPDGAG